MTPELGPKLELYPTVIEGKKRESSEKKEWERRERNREREAVKREKNVGRGKLSSLIGVRENTVKSMCLYTSFLPNCSHSPLWQQQCELKTGKVVHCWYFICLIIFHNMWDLPRSGIKPMSPALAGRFLTTGLPGKSFLLFIPPPKVEFGLISYT